MVASLASVSWRNSRCQGSAYPDIWFFFWRSLVMMRILCISKNWRRITPILVKLKILGWLFPITATKLDDGIAKMDGKLRKTKLISISKILVPFLYVPIHALMAVAYLPKLALVMLDGKIPLKIIKQKFNRKSSRDGFTCGECVPLGGCLHGWCKDALECDCSLAKDRRMRDKYEGAHCDRPKCSQGCKHGTCDEPDECT